MLDLRAEPSPGQLHCFVLCRGMARILVDDAQP